MTKSLPDSERAEKIVAYLTDPAYDFYFDSFITSISPTEESEHFVLLHEWKIFLPSYQEKKR